MDLLLQGFLSSSYPELPAAEQRAFERLLDEADLDILAWISGRADPADPDYRTLVLRLRQVQPASPGEPGPGG